MTPADLPGEQRLVAGHLNIAPSPAERQGAFDFFANSTEEIVFRTAHKEIVLETHARVERLARTRGLDISPDLAGLVREIAQCRTLAPDAPVHFIGPSERLVIEPAITSYVRDLMRPEMTVLQVVQTLGGALHGDMTFDSDATTVDTPPLDAFTNRRGVCQDIAHIMIAGLRGIGVPAGYVSGLLNTRPPPGQPRLEGADATHAWVRVWCGADTGWIEFDPTNNIMVDTDHIVLARGRDYSDVAPVKGVLRIAGRQQGAQTVDVVPVEPN